MQGYGSSQGQCYSCGMFHHHSQSCDSSLSMVFSSQNDGVFSHYDQTQTHDSFVSSSSSVDCTLSLGTPSTRLCEEDEKRRRSTSSCTSNFWGVLHKPSSKTAQYVPPYSHNTNKTNRGGGNGGGNGGCGNDPLLARRCANCDTTSTPLWRNGPRGPKSLCNACGIRFKKEERRTTTANGRATAAGMTKQYNQAGYNYQNATSPSSWTAHTPTSRVAWYSPSEYSFIDDVNSDHRDADSASAVPFLSWRLNVRG